MKNQKAYYTVFGLKDGTVLSALQTRKPPKMELGRRIKIDEDGVWNFYVQTVKSLADMPDKTVIIRHLAMAGRLNTRRAIRELIFPRLYAIEQQINTLKAQLDRIEQALAGVCFSSNQRRSDS